MGMPIILLGACAPVKGVLSNISVPFAIEELCSNDCEVGLYAEYYSLYCLDRYQDQHYMSKKIGCEKEFEELVYCQLVEKRKRQEELQCSYEYEDKDDYDDAREDYYGIEISDDDYYSYYSYYYYNYYSSSSNDDKCDKKEDKFYECYSDFFNDIFDYDETEEYYSYYSYYDEVEEEAEEEAEVKSPQNPYGIDIDAILDEQNFSDHG